jgi:threonine 3-dehydrogenase
VITDVNDYRLQLAKKLTPNIVTVNPTKTDLRDVMSDLRMTEGFDVGLEMSGNPTAFNQMLATMVNGGRVALLGFLPSDMTINWARDIVFKGLFIKGIYGREMFETWYKMTSLLESGLDISPIITHRLPMEKFQEGFDAMGSGQSGKVVLTWAS